MHHIPEITIGTLLERFEVLLFDAYGVLVHYKGALPGSAALIRRLNEMGKPYYVLTNDASKLPTTAARRYQGFGLDLSPDRIITSGELLEGYFAEHRLTGARCAVLGPADSLRYVEDAGGRIVSPGEIYDVLVIADEAGFPFIETVDEAFTTLCHQLDRQEAVHLILPNPDLIYPKDGQGFGFTAGSIAGMFEAALERRYPNRTDLRFARLGKPNGEIFTEALSRSGTRDMVMIGDQLDTDIQGARAFGLEAVWIKSGVSKAMSKKTPPHLRPTYCMRSVATGF